MGWILPGQASGFGPASQRNNNTIYDTNVYGSKGDIIVSSLSREVPKVKFFPANPDFGPDIIASEEAEMFKEIWARNNNLHALLVDCARIFWNEDRVLAWTRYELNGQLYGFEGEDDTAPVTAQRPSLISAASSNMSADPRGRKWYGETILVTDFLNPDP